MGVPAFFRWLSRKYPAIVVNCYEEKVTDIFIFGIHIFILDFVLSVLIVCFEQLIIQVAEYCQHLHCH